MRQLLPILMLLVAGCGDRQAEEAGGEGAVAEPQPSTPEAAGADAAGLQALIDQAITRALPGGASAKFRNLRAGSGGAACGEVALQSAVYRPFVVSPQAVATIAAGPEIAFEDPSDQAADAWIRWCATPEDLLALGPKLRAAESNAPPAEIELPMPLPMPPPDAPPAEEKTARPAPPPPPPPKIDSFFNSVQRPGQET